MLLLFWLCLASSSLAEANRKIHVIGHGWHTGIVIPLDEVDASALPAFEFFKDWPAIEIGWGDEGFYRGGDSISFPMALKAVATPTPTVLHIVGVNNADANFPNSELIEIDLDEERFEALLAFIQQTFSLVDEKPVDLGEGIYGFSRFFRAEGSYYFPKTCNVWTLKALNAAGFPVFPAAGIRTENVMNQAGKYGNSLRRFPGRSRVSVLIAIVAAIGAYRLLCKRRRLFLIAWGSLILSVIALVLISLGNVNGMGISDSIQKGATWCGWSTLAFVGTCYVLMLRKAFRWRRLMIAAVAVLLVLAGLSPL